jgi:4-hydroxy-tetrahydrodipicolinate reductase
MIKIGLFGYRGRMGQAIVEDVEGRTDCVLIAGLVRNLTPDLKTPVGTLLTIDADDVIARSDILIDFTLAEGTPAHAHKAALQGKPFLSGTTGLDSAGHDALKAAAQKIPVLYAPNTSLSLAAMKQITRLAARLLSGFDFDISILDEHHRMKKDAPSGTAKALGDAILDGNRGHKHPSYASIRAGYTVGEHEVGFFGHGETIRLRHSVTDRNVFARGAVQAALWLHDKPAGLYGMEDLLALPRAPLRD